MRKLGDPYGDGLYHLSYWDLSIFLPENKSEKERWSNCDELMRKMVDTAEPYQELEKSEG